MQARRVQLVDRRDLLRGKLVEAMAKEREASEAAASLRAAAGSGATPVAEAPLGQQQMLAMWKDCQAALLSLQPILEQACAQGQLSPEQLLHLGALKKQNLQTAASASGPQQQGQEAGQGDAHLGDPIVDDSGAGLGSGGRGGLSWMRARKDVLSGSNW